MPDRRARFLTGAVVSVLAAAFASGTVLPAGELTDAKVTELEVAFEQATAEAAARMVAPYLGKPDPRLAPLVADVLGRGESLPAETQEALYQALAPLADKRVYEPAARMSASADAKLAQIGIRLLGKCGHPKAPETLIAHFRKTDKPEQQALAMAALGELKDAAARPFVQEVLRDAKDPDLRDEAVIAAARLGGEVEPLAFLQANAHMKETIANLNQGLNYTKRAHPKEYVTRVRRIKDLDDRLGRLVPHLKAACEGKAQAFLQALQAADNVSLAEHFAPHAPFAADRLAPEASLPLLAHRSDALAVAFAKALWGKGEPAQASVRRALEEMAKAEDNARRERAALLSRALSLSTAAPADPATVPAVPGPAAGTPKAEQPGFVYHLWDGYRFGTTPELMERDLRYYRDLGFTHSQMLVPLYEKEVPERRRQLLGLFAKYDLLIGLYFSWDFSGLNEGWEQMIEKGMALRKKRVGEAADFNPMHPEVIRYWSEGALRTVDAHRSLDAFNRIRFVLIGSEFTWDLPKPEDLPPATVAVILKAAREDGVLGPEEKDWGKLGHWWAGSHGKGRDWRLRNAFEDGLVARLPDAECWVDPIWAVKIVRGFGGDWGYISDDPMNIAVSVVRLKAACWPSPCMHSTQLTRESGGGFIPHDHLMEANLLSVCLGADRLYHWGLGTVEPGREENPALGKKDVKPTPEGFPWFRENHIDAKDWPKVVKRVHADRETGAGKRLWDALDPKVRKQIEDEAVLTGGDAGGAGEAPGGGRTQLQGPLTKALNEVLKRPDFYDAKAFGETKLSARAAALAARREKQGNPSGEDLAELNRLLIEALFSEKPLRPDRPVEPAVIRATPEPNLREMREQVQRCRKSVEPAVRSTGRLLRDRGSLFREWKPIEPRLALLDGIYGDAGPVVGLIAASIPFELMRSPEHRRAKLASCRFAAVAGGTVAAEDYEDLLKVCQAGGGVFVPEGFQPPEGRPALGNSVVWSPKAEGKAKASPRERREARNARAQALRTATRKAGLLPYFDTDSLDLVMRGFVYKDQPMLFVVNDKRGSSRPEKPDIEDQGLPNEAEFLIRENGTIARVVDIDSGEEMKVSRADGVWRFRDTIPPAWFRIYAVVKEGQEYRGPAPLAAAPAVRNPQAARDAATGAVKLSWALPFDDWMGCDVQWYRILRGEGNAEPVLLTEIAGRIMTGPGGLVKEFADETAEKGKAYAYRVQAVTPLRRPGPLSGSVAAAP